MCWSANVILYALDRCVRWAEAMPLIGKQGPNHDPEHQVFDRRW